MSEPTPEIPAEDVRVVEPKTRSKRIRRRSPMLRFLGWSFSILSVLGVVGAAAVGLLIYHAGKDLPDYSQLQKYEPPVMTRVHAGDGELLAEFARERRLFLPVQAVPKLVINAFLAAEDKNFYEHTGIDPAGIVRAAVTNFQNRGQNRRPQGASTITQQVAKNFLLSNETSFDRKIKEAILSMRIEATFSKDKILELYLNEIYLGLGAYGVAAASLLYFDKSVHELTLAEAAYLASLPKAPNNYHPVRQRERAIERRNWVLDRMAENGVAAQADVDAAKKTSLEVTFRSTGAQLAASEYFAEEVRRELFERFGEKKLYEGGLSVRTTLDPKLQVAARKALTDGFVRYDEAQGYRGPVTGINLQAAEWGAQLADIAAPNDIAPWRMAVVLEVGAESARIGLRPVRNLGGQLPAKRETAQVTLEGVRWARRGRGVSRVSEVLKVGDVIYVDPLPAKDGQWRLRQIPEISGALVAMDPHTGRVFAMVGGFSFNQSEFNRATQALRQPGSSIKPLVYAAALDNGYTPSTVVLDAPVEIDQGAGLGVWRPENYSGKFYGPQTLRFGLEHSRNVMTVRLTQDIGMPIVTEYAKRFGVYDDLLPVLSMALGAGETTLMRMSAGYAIMANGGKKVRPTLIDRVQDRWGATLFRHDARECQGCSAEVWNAQDEPTLTDMREQVLDPLTAYQITSIMEGVVQRGTGTALREVGKPIAGKTGTTNDEKDAWFIGYTPDLVVGVYLGYDKPKPMGKGSTGGGLAAPIVRDFMKVALEDKAAVPFRVPAGIRLIRVNRQTGLRASAEEGGILEAFKPGTAPPESRAFVGAGGDVLGGGISSGTGLY